MIRFTFNWGKIAAFILALFPFVYIVFGVFTQNLGSDPQKTIVLHFGEWSFRILIITLLLSPLRRLLGFKRAITYRRMLGLFVFFYASLHLVAYFIFYLGMGFGELAEEIIQRPYLIIGFLAWLLLIPLTVTSTKKAMRLLGKKWQKLHNVVYLILIVAWIHFFMQVKSDINEPLIYACIITLLFAERLVDNSKKKRKRRAKNTQPN